MEEENPGFVLLLVAERIVAVWVEDMVAEPATPTADPLTVDLVW